MSLHHENAARTHAIDSRDVGHYQGSITRIHADSPDEWRNIIGKEFWFVISATGARRPSRQTGKRPCEP